MTAFLSRWVKSTADLRALNWGFFKRAGFQLEERLRRPWGESYYWWCKANGLLGMHCRSCLHDLLIGRFVVARDEGALTRSYTISFLETGTFPFYSSLSHRSPGKLQIILWTFLYLSVCKVQGVSGWIRIRITQRIWYLKHGQHAGPCCQDFWPGRYGPGLRICIPDKFPGDAAAAAWGPHFERPMYAQTFARQTLITTLIILVYCLLRRPGDTALGKSVLLWVLFTKLSTWGEHV